MENSFIYMGGIGENLEQNYVKKVDFFYSKIDSQIP
jgi:hypothetical protein